jgi:hypothetical protein
MSDGRDRGAGAPPFVPTMPPVTTVPLAAQPMQRAVTQMSASAVPSTLESPKEALVLRAQVETRIEHGAQSLLTATVDDLNGTTLPDDTARDAAIREAAKLADARSAANQAAASAQPSSPRRGPPTMMSPSIGASGLPPPPGSAQESAVVDAVLPAAAFLPMETLDMGVPRTPSVTEPTYAPIAAGAQAHWGIPGAHPGAFEARDGWQPQPIGHAGPGVGTLPQPGLRTDPRAALSPPRRASTTLIVLCVVGAVVLLGVVVAVAGGAYLFKQRKVAAKAAQGGAASPESASSPGAPTAVAPSDARMAGAKARISTLSAGTLDGEAVRTAITAVLPRIDLCYAASELEPPNHETAAYDLDVAAAGAVTRVEPASTASRAPKLDACVGNALRTAKMPRSSAGTKVKLTLASRIGDAR